MSNKQGLYEYMVNINTSEISYANLPHTEIANIRSCMYSLDLMCY